MQDRDIRYYEDYVSKNFQNYLKDQLIPVPKVNNLFHVGEMGGLENSESLKFLCDLYDNVKDELKAVLEQREKDRSFIDERIKAYYQYNQEHQIDFLSDEYQTILGDEDSDGRIVIGPLVKDYCAKSKGKKVAPIPEYLEGFHVTLFGPPDDAKLSINAMNAYHRKLKGEPEIVETILETNKNYPKWGADDEDSKTPLRSDLIKASENLTACLNNTIEFFDDKRSKHYKLAQDNLSYPIKRFPGLALPTTFMFYQDNPLPLHLYDFALHLFEHWENPRALTFYVPKLENEEEARYIKNMIQTAEEMIQKIHPNYKMGTVRVIIVLENPRAVFRVNEIMDELYPYFVGASLGWHDYLGSTARLMKEDGNYRIPVKADPDIVIKYIKASHDLLANVVGERGGIKIGGMYGILPLENDLKSDTFQITIRGFFRDVITQLKRNLSGYWVAHPDFIRIGIAIVEAWRLYEAGDEDKLKGIINGLLNDKYANEIWDFVKASDIDGLDITDSLYDRSLIVTDIKESSFIANNHPDEIRYNVFQMLQYLTDWLSGNGCVALPTQIQGIPARVMDDLATAERSRWEVWHEITHGRFSVEDFIQIAHEEMNFIRRDLSNDKKIVQVKYHEQNAKWYDVSLKLMIKLMTDDNPVEFATELLLPFTIDSIRNSENPWDTICEIDPEKFSIKKYVEAYNYYFEMCGSHSFATKNAKNEIIDMDSIEKSIMSFTKEDILSAASFHGDIGQQPKTLDAIAKEEQKNVSNDSESIRTELLQKGQKYLNHFGMKYLISAKGKQSEEILEDLNTRLNNSEEQELVNAKLALFEITRKRILAHPFGDLKKKISLAFDVAQVAGIQIAVSKGQNQIQSYCLGDAVKGQRQVSEKSLFQIASLSKTFGSAFAIEFFKQNNIDLKSKVNDLLTQYKSEFRLTNSTNPNWGDLVEVKHLMSHNALNMHYVNGISSKETMPNIDKFLFGNDEYGYEKISVLNEPGKKFNYSGAGFIVLEYLIQIISGKTLNEVSNDFFQSLGLKKISFNQKSIFEKDYAFGHDDNQNVIKDNYLMFPSFAAGMVGPAFEVLSFLEHLTNAYHDIQGSGGISHDTAVLMSHGFDKGCQEFMASNMGLGVFIIEAGDNQFFLHQGANDGFRAIYLYCFTGPDRYKGFCLLSNGELNAVKLNSIISQEILKSLNISGIDFSKFNSSFSTDNLSQEEVVNIGYKNLVLDAFKPTLPEAIKRTKSIDPLLELNLLRNSKILAVSNQRFARAENLFSIYPAEFDPKLFGKQGKVMDSWETARHNEFDYDEITLELEANSKSQGVYLSTKYHDGNQVEWVEIINHDESTILAKTQMNGHSYRFIKFDQEISLGPVIKIRVYPDGGLTRVALFKELPLGKEELFKNLSDSECIRFEEIIPQTQKPMGISLVEFNPQKCERINYADITLGAKLLSASDEHYAPAKNVLSPIKPLNMFDGFESKRSRNKNHNEEFEIELSKEIKISHIELDFTYFVNNNPKFMGIYATSNGELIELKKFDTKAYAGNKMQVILNTDNKYKNLIFKIFPDGGLNRVKVFGSE